MNPSFKSERICFQAIEDDDYAAQLIAVSGDPYPLAVADVYSEANARRLVACWNACEGIPTEMLEAVCKVPLAAVMLAEQRDEMLTLLSEVSQNFTREDDLPNGLLHRIDAVIAEVGGAAG